MDEWYIFMIENLMKQFTMTGQTEFRAYMVTGYFFLFASPQDRYGEYIKNDRIR